MTPTILPFNHTHAAPAAQLTNHFIQHTHTHFADTPQSEQDWLDTLNNQPPHHPLLAAEVDAQFAGYARAYTWRSRHAYQHTAECAVYVHEHFRGQRIGTALYTHLLEELKGRGGHTAVAAVALPNDPSQRFHEHMGFQHVGTFKQVGHKYSSWVDVAFYQRIL